jgi:hypothetical protein
MCLKWSKLKQLRARARSAPRRRAPTRRATLGFRATAPPEVAPSPGRPAPRNALKFPHATRQGRRSVCGSHSLCTRLPRSSPYHCRIFVAPTSQSSGAAYLKAVHPPSRMPCQRRPPWPPPKQPLVPARLLGCRAREPVPRGRYDIPVPRIALAAPPSRRRQDRNRRR